jgi:hypothetical protein
MTGRIAAMSLDGTPISQTDLDRMAEEERLYAERQRRTVRVIASAARDAEDCKMLLDMLGLDAATIAAARTDLPHSAPSAA